MKAWDLKVHKEKHCGIAAGMEFKCPVCSEGYGSLNAMQEHKAWEHELRPCYKCMICRLSFFSGARFSTHKKKKHPGVKFPKHIWDDEFVECEDEDSDKQPEQDK